MAKSSCWVIGIVLWLPCLAPAQEASSGLSLPMTVAGDVRYSPSAVDGNSVSGGFRALLSPNLQLGSHWFAYSVLSAQSPEYFEYSVGAENDRPVSFSALQAYVGYRAAFKSATLLIKGGRLAAAFGHYPLEYDDAKSPFIDPPPLYTNNSPLRPDQIPCNLREVVTQSYDEPMQFSCGGSASERYGIVPATLYGIPGIEAQLSWNRFDARIQITNSSPANPQSLRSKSQFVQGTAGAGYSLHGGLHIGVSGFRGPYLDHVVAAFLPTGKSLTDFLASGFGWDAQWSGGPWSLEGEWQRFRFGVPGFIRSPTTDGGYLQVKRIISPRVFAAVRSTYERPGSAVDAFGSATSQIDAYQEVEEFVLGYRINRLQLLKSGFNFSERNAWSLSRGYWPAEQHIGLEFQLVTSLPVWSKGFR